MPIIIIGIDLAKNIFAVRWGQMQSIPLRLFHLIKSPGVTMHTAEQIYSALLRSEIFICIAAIF